MPLRPNPLSHEEQLAGAQELKKAYTDFVGKTFFGQMLKSMRSTVGEAAYFNGGKTEQIFRSQLDQQIADKMSDATADQIAEPMFRQQFPREAKLLADAAAKNSAPGFQDLNALRRR